MKVLVADDHLLIRIGLRQVLQRLDPEVEIVETDEADEAIRAIERTDGLALAVIEPRLPGMSVGRLLKALHGRRAAPPCLLFSTVEKRADVLRVIELGISGFLFKTATEGEILDALTAVLAGGAHLPRSLRDGSDEPAPAPPMERDDVEAIPAQSLSRLTKRQQEVLEQLTLGRSNADIANELGTSEHTIRIHVSAILKSLNVSNRTKAALAAAPHFHRARLQRTSA